MCLLLLTFAAGVLHAQPTEFTHGDSVIFRIEGGVANPIVRLHSEAGKTTFQPPDDFPAGQDQTEYFNHFDAFIASKPSVALYSGGRLLRSTKLAPIGSEQEFEPSARVVRTHPSARLAVFGVKPIPSHRSTRRAATPVESATIRRLVRAWFRGARIEEALLSRIKASRVLSTELRPKAGRAIVGRFDLETPDTVYQVFAVAEPGPSGYRLTLAEGIPPQKFDDDRQEPEYIDQIDLDGDGVDEIILQHLYYETWDYSIYRFDGSFWRKVYSGGGGGV